MGEIVEAHELDSSGRDIRLEQSESLHVCFDALHQRIQAHRLLEIGQSRQHIPQVAIVLYK